MLENSDEWPFRDLLVVVVVVVVIFNVLQLLIA